MIKINKKAINSVKKKEGITLIALVVTIVVLLILAGVSLNLVLGNNGIITKAQDAKLMTRAGSAEDEVELWKSDNYIARTSNQATVDKETMLQGLKDKNLVYEEEIDRDNEIITIKKKDGTIVKEINYSGVIINISKTPEKEKAGAVFLQVTSVEGLTNISIKSEEEFNTFVEQIERMDEETKKDSIKKLFPKLLNEKEGTNFSTFTDVLQFLYEQGEIEANTEEAFWAGSNPEDYSNIIMEFLGELYYDRTTNTIATYEIINPDNELSDTYVATENGTYTFIVKDLITGKSYSKSVEVTNIDDSLDYYVGYVSRYYIGLKNKDTNEPTTFENAYIIWNGEEIDMSFYIDHEEEYDEIFSNCVRWTLQDADIDGGYEGENVMLKLEKDGINYIGIVKLIFGDE